MTTGIDPVREPVPGGVRQRVLDAAMRERQPRHTVLAVEAIPPTEALRRTADDLHALLRSLSASDWTRPALRNLDVQGLVGHLIGVERHVHRCLANPGDAELADADHISSTDQTANEQAGRLPQATRADWRSSVDHTLDLVDAISNPGDRQVAIHGIRLPLMAFLIVRSFELWTHDNDIRRATGRQESRPDAATLQRMTELAAQMVPVGVQRTTGADIDRPVRLVLTGDGGGVWDLGPVDEQVPSASRIVTDAVGFCRLIARRVAPHELVIDVWGDRQLVETVLAGAGSLALD